MVVLSLHLRKSEKRHPPSNNCSICTINYWPSLRLMLISEPTTMATSSLRPTAKGLNSATERVDHLKTFLRLHLQWIEELTRNLALPGSRPFLYLFILLSHLTNGRINNEVKTSSKLTWQEVGGKKAWCYFSLPFDLVFCPSNYSAPNQ